MSVRLHRVSEKDTFSLFCTVGMAEHAAHVREKRNACRVLVGNHEGKRLSIRLKCRLEDNIKMGLNRMGGYGLDYSGLG